MYFFIKKTGLRIRLSVLFRTFAGMNYDSLKDKRIAVLISGGVDSGVVTHLLYNHGLRPDLYYIKIGMEGEDSSCSAEEDIELSTATACRYGLKLQVVDLQKEYWDRVVGYTIERVKSGLTPNPDVMCNKLIKFGAFEEKVGYRYDVIATGHYATVFERNGRYYLGTAKDPVKDQTDFLAQMSYAQICKLVCPLGGLMKEEVRRIAEEAHLPSARRKDSQGICFLGKINYNDFLRRFLGEQEGKIIDIETNRILGTHKGFWFHTIGQRKGLGLAGGPWFVVKKNVRKNIVFVARGWDTQLQYGRCFKLADFHEITEPLPLDVGDSMDISFKIRHVDHFMHGTITRQQDHYAIASDEPVQGIAPGQFGCIYDKDMTYMIGSGEISL